MFVAKDGVTLGRNNVNLSTKQGNIKAKMASCRESTHAGSIRQCQSPNKQVSYVFHTPENNNF